MGGQMSAHEPRVGFDVLKREIIMLGEDIEVELEDEELGHITSKRCKKSDGHSTIYPWRQFTMDKLPPGWQLPGVLDLIMYQARNTVKIRVPYISPARPEGYPLYDNRGKWLGPCGTGTAVYIDEVMNQPPINCPLKNCKRKRPHKVTPVFGVETATHVLFDDAEAEHATFELFYDYDGAHVVKGEVVSVFKSGREDDDQCILNCVSHDLSLFNKYVLHNVASFLWIRRLNPVPRSSLSHREQKSPLVVVVSHPHGCHKHVSVGNLVGYKKPAVQYNLNIKLKDVVLSIEKAFPDWRQTGCVSSSGQYISPEAIRERKQAVQKYPDITVMEYEALKNPSIARGKHLTLVTYTAGTCRGSSGATVNVFVEKDDGDWVVPIEAHHFRGADKVDGKWINVSGSVGFFDGPVVDKLLLTLREEKHMKKRKK